MARGFDSAVTGVIPRMGRMKCAKTARYPTSALTAISAPMAERRKPFPMAEKCADGSDPKTILPGQVTGQESNTALKTGTENITSANDIVGLVTAFATSLLGQLAQNAINLANSAINGVINTQSPSNTGLTGVQSSTLTNTGNTSAATQGPAQCLPSIQNATLVVSPSSTNVAVVNLSAIGGAIDTACVANNTCPATENSDGTPIYSWTAPGLYKGGPACRSLDKPSRSRIPTPGTYTATVTASTDNSQSSCQITVQ